MTKGWKTSEFWLTALFNLSALLTLVAGILPAQTAPVVVAAAGIVTALYNFGRSLVKSADATSKAPTALSSGTPTMATALSGMVAAVASSQRRATDKVSTRDVVGTDVLGTVERAALEGVLGASNALTGSSVPTESSVPGDLAESQGSEVLDERNAG